MRTRIVVDPSSSFGVREALASLPDVDAVYATDERAVARALEEIPVLVTKLWHDEYLRPGLRWVQTGSAGYERFPIEELRRRGIVLCGGRGLHAVVAEHAIALLLAAMRDIHVSVRRMADRRWEPHVGQELAGRTAVVAGLGTIGEGIARRLGGWDVRLVGVTRTPTSYRGILSDVRPLAELAAACAEASVLFVALPQAPETRGLVSAAVLDALGRGYVVNVARGPLVDEAALVERLTDGRLAGAGLDVVESEPLASSSPLWTLPNVVLTPHMGGSSPRYAGRFAELLSENLRAFHGLGPWRDRIC
ncbi:MAG: D-2-hydroxyacid dehydrogenase [Chloroflexota bacterium]|nr:D-2-hydroxyacid dehydrogenase [Chloroflexota bacterium]